MTVKKRLVPPHRTQALSNLGSERGQVPFDFFFLDVSALQNMILLFCNLFYTVIVQNNFSCPYFFCSVSKWCSLNLGRPPAKEASLSVNVERGTSAQAEETITNGHLLFLRHPLQSLLWVRSPLHHVGRLPALISAHCCQHLPSQVVMTSAEGPFSFNKKQSLFLQSCLPGVI